MTDANDILMGSGAAAAKFPTIGAIVTGTVLREPTSSQQTNFRTKTPETWKDGSAKMQVLVQLSTAERDPQKPDDDGARTLYIKGKELTKAVRDAVRASGANGIHTGGVLTVQYIADGPAEAGLDQGPKLYAASYQPPAVSFNGVTPPAAPATPQVQQQTYAPPPAQQAYVAPPAPVSPAPMAAPQQQLPCPPNVDPGMWGRLSLDQQQAVLAASAAQAQPGF